METQTRPSPRNGKSKLGQARAKRQTSSTQAVVATVSTPKRLAPARSVAHKPTTKNTALPAGVVARAKHRIKFFEQNGRGLS